MSHMPVQAHVCECTCAMSSTSTGMCVHTCTHTSTHGGGPAPSHARTHAHVCTHMSTHAVKLMQLCSCAQTDTLAHRHRHTHLHADTHSHMCHMHVGAPPSQANTRGTASSPLHTPPGLYGPAQPGSHQICFQVRIPSGLPRALVKARAGDMAMELSDALWGGGGTHPQCYGH